MSGFTRPLGRLAIDREAVAECRRLAAILAGDVP